MFLEEWKIKGFGLFKQRKKREATAEVYKVGRGVPELH
jgi:hypothetical protein